MLLEQTLLHIITQKTDEDVNYEVIIVDNASTDGTQQKAKEIWYKNNQGNINLNVIFEPTPGLANARQRGINEAKYEYLVFCDDDNRLDEYYLSNVVKLFNTHANAAVLGGNGTADFAKGFVQPTWFKAFYQSYATGALAANEGVVSSVYGAGMAVRKSVLKQLAGMCPMLLADRKQKQLTSGGDTEICLRARLAGYQILYSPELTFKHFLVPQRLTWPYLKKLHIGLAKSYMVINLYELALNNLPAKLPPFYWLKKTIYYWGIFFKYWPKHFAAYKKKEGAIEEIRHLMWKHIALVYMASNFKTIAIYRQIIELKNNLK
ncbi:hypothetical protein GCM10007352_24030 [Mucilaginibacter phyllosphaerae]|uniref:Glycosyltransferase involved in cell wall biosynthesis n=1 Tax=Mucilaginibacter phyllosphaerae TaxID=1812349 RepID=A0ABR6I691_9SPHI|nr:glycosyltransferase involved in cell wall biosynthesis [Mucilaginibacter phyllosphaerae]GGH15328.1 hypothetical protein GCM10007352_24030 [Mucilaginibacter phyllosphaerae]